VSSKFSKFKDLKREIVSESGKIKLFLFKNKNQKKLEYRATMFIKKLFVTSSFEKEPVEFVDLKYKTGPKEWLSVSNGTATFEGKSMEMISAHPIHGSDAFVKVVIPPNSKKNSNLFFEGGIADSGKCGDCKPVKVTISQDDKEISFSTEKDGKLHNLELKDFISSKPVAVTIVAEHSGMRHFYFNIVYK